MSMGRRASAKSNFAFSSTLLGLGSQMEIQKSWAILYSIRIRLRRTRMPKVHSTHWNHVAHNACTMFINRDRMQSRKQLRKLLFFPSSESAIICFRLCHMAMTIMLKRAALFLPYVAHNLNSFGQSVWLSVLMISFFVVVCAPPYWIASCFLW